MILRVESLLLFLVSCFSLTELRAFMVGCTDSKAFWVLCLILFVFALYFWSYVFQNFLLCFHDSDALMCNMLTFLHELFFLFFVQLIPSPSLLLRANWPIRPSLYHSFPSAADLLCLILLHHLSDAVKSIHGRAVSNLGALRNAAAGTSVICFQYPVGSFTVRLLS